MNLNTRTAPTITLLSEKQLAELVNISIATLRRWRLLGAGPRFIRLRGLGSAVRYRPEDVATWLDSRSAGGGQLSAARDGTEPPPRPTAALPQSRRGHRAQ